MLIIRIRSLLLILLVFALSCATKKEEKSPIPDDKFIAFYADYMALQDENKFFGLDSLASQKRFDSLYQSYSITKQMVQATRSAYNKDLAKWQTTYEKVLARLDSLQNLKSPKTPFN